MGKENHNYKICSKCHVAENAKSYNYDFGKMKKFTLRISLNAFCVEYSLQKMKKFEELIKSNEVSEAIRKIAFLHIFLFSKPIDLSEILLSIDEDSQKTQLIEDFKIVSDLNRDFSSEWNTSILINKVLKTSKSDREKDSRFSSISAFLIALSKKNEIERFQNLWISMNGLYSYCSKKIKEIVEATCTGRIHECKQLSLFKFLYSFSSDINNNSLKNYEELKEKLAEYINYGHNTDYSIPKSVYEQKYKDINKMLETYLSQKKIDITAYGCLIIDYAYKMRCELFHANKPIPIVLLKEDCELKILKLINGLLEAFLLENIPAAFADDFISKKTSYIMSKQKEIKDLLEEKNNNQKKKKNTKQGAK